MANKSPFKYKKLQEVPLHKFEVANLKYSYQKALAGELFHRYLELYAKGLSFDELHQQFSKTYIGDLSELKHVIKSLLKVTSPSFENIFENARVEWGFNSCIQDNYLISGQIDLWGIDAQNVIHVIDYKSGSSRYQKKAALQVHLYKEVLQKNYPDHFIRTHVLYIGEGKLITLETDLQV